MAYRDLEQFLRNLSTHATLREAFAKDPEGVMREAGLSDQEMQLLRAKDTDAIKKYLGESYLAAVMIHLTD